MEANKLWRTCVKKAKARRRRNTSGVSPKRDLGRDFFLAKELCKCAQRLVPRENIGLRNKDNRPSKTSSRSSQQAENHSLSYKTSICQAHNVEHELGKSLRGWPQQNNHETVSVSTISYLEWCEISDRPQLELDIIQLRGELSCLKRQLWTQAQLVNAHNKSEIHTFKTETCKIQALWRAALERSKYNATLHMQATLKTAATVLQARYRSKSREAAAIRLQAVLRGAAQTRIQRLKRAHANNQDLRCDLTVCNATIIKLYEELNCMRASYSAACDSSSFYKL